MLHDVCIGSTRSETKIWLTNCSKVELRVNNVLHIEGLDDDGNFAKCDIIIKPFHNIFIEEAENCGRV